MADPSDSAHYHAAETFARRVRDQYGDVVDKVILYGSVARNEQRGVHSDIDLIVVVNDAADKITYERQIRKLAYDMELDHAVVLSVLVLSASEYQARDDPFLQHVQHDAKRLYG